MSGRITNARIESAYIGFEDRGILCMSIMFQQGGSHQGFGTWALENANGGKFVRRVLEVVGVQDVSKLAGRIVRIERDGDAWSSTIIAVGHILEDRWFNPRKEFTP